MSFEEEDQFEHADMDEILPRLYLGGYDAANDKRLLQHHGVTHVLNCTEDIHIFFPNDFKYLRLAVEDDDAQNLSEHFETAWHFMDEAMSKGSVFVHCMMGMSRSSTIVLAYMMKRRSMSLLDAYVWAKQRREIVSPNPGFMRQLATLETVLCPYIPNNTINPDHYEEERYGYFFRRRAG